MNGSGLSADPGKPSQKSGNDQQKPLEKLTPQPAREYENSIRPILEKFCIECHEPGKDHDAFAFLKAKSADDVANDRSLWKSVAEQLRNRTMPPADDPQPDEGDRLRIANWIDETMRSTACRTGEFAGHVTTRRLNRVEYDNTMRDLLGVNLDLSHHFPVDGSGGEGFNNNGETLFLPPMLMERYLEAASQALNAAIHTKPLKLTFTAIEMTPPVASADKQSSRELSKMEDLQCVVTTYSDSEYLLETNVSRGTETASGALKIDGINADRISLEKVSPGEKFTQKSIVRLTRGIHTIAIHSEGDAPLTVHQLRLREQRKEPTKEQQIHHQRLVGSEFGKTPAKPHDVARNSISKLLREAFRRPVSDGETDRYIALYKRAAERGDPYEECLKLAFKAILVSPHFLFRIEEEPSSTQPAPINDHELAVRLSYFLWSTMPDEELRRLADTGQLSDPKILVAQMDRLLNDPRSEIFAEEFMGQWLGTHEVGERIAPQVEIFKDFFNADMLIDFRDEPMHFFAYLLKNDRSLLELLDADYTILNRRLKEHYGYLKRDKPLEKTRSTPRRGTGGTFEHFPLPDNKRGGLLGMSAVHLATSYPNRTSPVLRGGWVLETLLGIKVPNPPPDIPQLKRNAKTKKSVREQLSDHRAIPACAACHNLIDPLGFALENYDVLGRWRDEENGTPIDVSATLPSGEKFSGPEGLRKVLLDRKSDFIRHLTRKMLGYAIGRSLEDGDDCTIQQIAEHVETDDFRTRTLIREIVLSPPFRMSQQISEQ